MRYPERVPLDYAGLRPFVDAALPRAADFVLVGESFSGPLAIAAAAMRPRGLRGLVLCGSFARNPRPGLAWMTNAIGAIPLGRALVRAGANAMLGRSCGRDVRELVARTVTRIPPAVLRARLRTVLQVDVTRGLSAVDVPILCINATRDLAVPSSASMLIQEIRPDARTVGIDAPHFLLQTQPAAVADQLLRFAGSVDRARD
ncbi:MAG TPA: alpha/beta hydrolase [Lysobacter sp.]